MFYSKTLLNNNFQHFFYQNNSSWLATMTIHEQTLFPALFKFPFQASLHQPDYLAKETETFWACMFIVHKFYVSQAQNL